MASQPTSIAMIISNAVSPTSQRLKPSRAKLKRMSTGMPVLSDCGAEPGLRAGEKFDALTSALDPPIQDTSV